jgi:aspartate/methionine/tyrosine aminotransferase
MSLKIARRGVVPPFIVMDVMRAAALRAEIHGDVLHLEVGQPSSGAPKGAIEAAKRAMDREPLGYTLALGIDPLRERIARHYKDDYGINLSAERVVVTTGSSGAFLLAFLTAFEAGDRVGVAAPSYPAYRNILTALGVEPVLIPVGPDSHFQTDLAVLKQQARGLDGLILASPSNPTGSMLERPALHQVADWCFEQGIRLISDEIYHGVTYGVAAASAADRPGSIVVNSFSKYYAMTGWRLGWLVLPEDMIRAVECLAQNLFIAPPSVSQHAALASFDCKDELDANVARYAKNRDILLNELPAAGFKEMAPADGAFYLYAHIAHWTDDSLDFCRRMLAETGVAATPGVDFDPLDGRHFMRFSFAGSTEDMIEAAKRLKAWTSAR